VSWLSRITVMDVDLRLRTPVLYRVGMNPATATCVNDAAETPGLGLGPSETATYP